MKIFRELQGKIVICIFGEILYGLLYGHTAKRIIFELSAAMVAGDKAALAAQKGIVVDLCRVHTVGTGLFNVFPKEHDIASMK